MSSIAVLGGIWGDEAKAKIVDVLAKDADVIVRFQGGNNAGHTIRLDDNTYVFHLVPSGILHPGKICVIGSGVVIEPFQLLEEISDLEKKGISFQNRFFIDPRVSVVLPLHKELDVKKENRSDGIKIGTTKRGIGPCYSDAISRVGFRLYDLLKKESIETRMKEIYSYHRQEPVNLGNMIDELFSAGEELKKYFRQVPYFLSEIEAQSKKILFEGAQGALLDVFFGTYPFVTSSHTISGGISVGSGYAPQKIKKIIGVYKSYFTRVGEGPFPTELNNEIGNAIRNRGNEFGSTTGRPRRCGWFDAVAAKYTAMINGVDEIALTLLDVLTDVDKIKICVGYKYKNKILKKFPYDSDFLADITPEYLEIDGWNEDICGIKNFNDLPANTRNYVRKIEKLLEVKVSIISVGPDRNQTILL